MTRREGIRDKDLVNSEEELVSKFIRESVGLYVQQKSRESFGASREEVMLGIKETFVELLDGLPDYTEKLDQRRVNTLLSAFRDNLDSYIQQVDTELTKDRDAYMLKHPEYEPEEAMALASHQSRFGKIAQELKKQDVTIKDTGWKILADFFKELGIPKLANFFEQKNEESKLVSLAKSAMKGSEDLIVKTAPKGNAIMGVPLKGDGKQRSV